MTRIYTLLPFARSLCVSARRPAPFFAACLVVLATGCGRESSPDAEAVQDLSEEAVQAPVPFEAPRNCLFIILDATAAGHVSLYGYERETTPFIDSLGKDGVYLSEMYSQATETPPSVWSYFTGRRPYRPTRKPKVIGVRETDHVIAETFRDAGFATGAFSENIFVTEKMGYGKGFDTFTFVHHREAVPGEKIKYFRDDAPSKELVAKTIDWIDSNKDGRWFCYVHLLRPHNPYAAQASVAEAFVNVDLPEGADKFQYVRVREQRILLSSAFKEVDANLRYLEPPSDDELKLLIDLYDGNLAFADTLVKELYSFLETEGLAEDTLVIVASDHGEAFMEHGVLLHASIPYQEMQHVPFVMNAPEGTGIRNGRVDVAVEMVDLVPTLLELFDLSHAGPVEGRSFLPLLRGETDTHKDYVICDNIRTDSMSFRLHDRKLILRFDEALENVLSYEVYDLASDPRELHNLFTEESAIPELLGPALEYTRTWKTDDSFSLDMMTQAQIEELQALGYLTDVPENDDK